MAACCRACYWAHRQLRKAGVQDRHPVGVGLAIDLLLFLVLGLSFYGLGTRNILVPGCGSGGRLRSWDTLDVVIMWENTTHEHQKMSDQALRYTLRSMEMHKLAARARKIHIVAQGGANSLPPYLRRNNSKLSIVPHSALLRHGETPPGRRPWTMVESLKSLYSCRALGDVLQL